METGKSAYLAALIIVAALAATAFAAGPIGSAAGGDGAGNMLSARVQHLSCSIDFSVTVMGDVANAVPQSSGALGADASKLDADKAQLSSLAAGGDPKAFDDFVKGTLTPDAKQGVSDLHAARQGFKDENVTNGTRAQLKGEYDAAQSTFASCNNGAVGALLQARITQFTSEIGKWDGKISTFGQKGFDTTAMQAVADGATSSVVAPLQAALASGNDAQMKAALQTYCLGDGCDGGKNASTQPYDYHGYARMALETLQSMVNKAEADPRLENLTAAGMAIDTSKLDDAKAQLDNVRAMLATVGTAKYTTDQDTAIQSGLKQAMQDIKDYMQGVKDSMQKFRQQRAAARGNMTGGFNGSRGMGGRNFGNRSGNFTGGPGAGGRNFGNRTIGGRMPGSGIPPVPQPGAAGSQNQ